MSFTSIIPSYWLRSKEWDGFWIFSGIWLLFISILLPQAGFEKIYIIATLLLWIGHRFSSIYLAFFTPIYRPLICIQFKRFFIFPLLVILLVFTLLFIPESWVSIPLPERIFFLIFIDYFANLQHFAMQHYGILRIYHFRAKLAEVPLVKKWEKNFCLIVGGGGIMIAEMIQGTNYLPNGFNTFFNEIDNLEEGIKFGATLTILVMTVSLIYLSLKNKNTSLPKLLYLLSVSGFGILAFYLHPFTFLMIWTTQHWLASIGISGHMASHEKNYTLSVKKLWAWRNQNFWRVILILCLVSLFLTPIMEIESVPQNERYGTIIFPFFEELVRTDFLILCLIGVGFSSGFIHYMMDRAIFRLSNAVTRKYTAPLLT